tara:strand:+ start:38 stop:2464 length:2427 start_codon:yes stop_codon:yes gene_type:complete
MAIYYIDFNGGNDSNDGLSFANRKQSFDGLISENDNSSDDNSIAGNEYRVMGMPAVNTGVNATWTKGGYGNYDANNNVINYVDINGVTATAPISISTNNAHGYSTGDVIWIYNVRGITAANGIWIITVTDANNFTLNNSSGTGTYDSQTNDRAWKMNHKVIKVNSGCKRIALCSGTTGVENNTHNQNNNLYGIVSSNVNISRRGWYGAIQNVRIQVQNSFGTGKAWYYTLPETLDLSAYQKISFHYGHQNDADNSVSHLSLKLCTDTTGDTAVHTVQIPGFASRGGFPIVHDFGTNLNSAIKSVALYVDTDVGSEDIRLRNIIAVKDANDGVSHCDVIGKNTTAEPVWWQCQYIQEDLIYFGMAAAPDIDDYASLNSNRTATYAGTGETVALHKITPFNIYRVGQDNDNNNFRYKFLCRPRYDGRRSASITKILGGWDQTNMTTQNSVTWVNVSQRDEMFIYTGSNSNIAHLQVEKFGQCGGDRTCAIRGNFTTINDIYGAGLMDRACLRFDNFYTRRGTTINGIYQTMGNRNIIEINDHNHFVEDQAKYIVKNVHHYGGGEANLDNITSQNVVFENVYLYSRERLFSSDSNNDTIRVDVKKLFASGIRYMSVEGSIRIHNSVIDNVLTEVYPHTVNDQGTSVQGQISFRNYNGTNNDHRIYLANGMIKSETSVRHGSDGIAWKIQPTIEHSGNLSFSARNNVDSNPLCFSLIKIFVEANKLVTFTAYLRRTNTGLTLRVAARRDKFGNYFSIASDAVANCTAAADTWQEVTLTFTPTDSAEITIDCEAFGGNSYTGYIDDISVTQAA